MDESRTEKRRRYAFVDVGGNIGQSVAVALSGKFNFERVCTFEPDSNCSEKIQSTYASAVRSGRLEVVCAALGAENGVAILSGSNQGGGATTIHNDKKLQDQQIQCKKLDVAEVVQDLRRQGFSLFVKLNCEGAEVEILERLCESGPTEHIVSIMADFDIVKYPGGYAKKISVLRRCRRAGLPVMLAERVMVGKTHEARLSNWLAHFPEVHSAADNIVPKPQRLSRRLKYRFRDFLGAIGLQKHKS